MEKKPNYTTADMSVDQFFYAYKELAMQEERHLLFESGRGGRYCIAGIQPLVTLQAMNGSELHLNWRDGSREVREGDSLELVTDFARMYEMERIPELPDFQGGITGFVSYDYVRNYEDILSDTENDLDTPDLFFYLFDRWAVLDMEEGTAFFMTLPDLDASDLKREWLEASAKGLKNQLFTVGQATDVDVSEEGLTYSVDGQQFQQRVRDVQQYISSGDVIQVNLSVRQSKPLTAHPLDMYEALRSFNPSPYMASIGSSDFDVVSGSPELLLKKRGVELSTRPIGGTRPRGKSEQEDLALKVELLSNEKEKGEHIMLVDLEREDLERVCLAGSVETNEFMVVEKYSHVMHLVSNVRGTANSSISNADIVKGVFPGGTITGAPKLRTMEIIEELEPTRRGLYTGSIGWFGFDGDFELNVVIRTAYIKDGIAHIQAGAGLVADSNPEAEYVESLNKAKALWQAKAMAEN